MLDDSIATARAAYQAFAGKDRAAMEALLADDFSFACPREGGVDREGYFTLRWPACESVAGFDFLHFAREGESVVVTYVGRSTSGIRFRNTEVVTVRDGKIAAIEARAPWSIPDGARRRRTPYKRRPTTTPVARAGA